LAAHSANRVVNLPSIGGTNEHECFSSDWKPHVRDALALPSAVVIALKPSASVTMS